MIKLWQIWGQHLSTSGIKTPVKKISETITNVLSNQFIEILSPLIQKFWIPNTTLVLFSVKTFKNDLIFKKEKKQLLSIGIFVWKKYIEPWASPEYKRAKLKFGIFEPNFFEVMAENWAAKNTTWIWYNDKLVMPHQNKTLHSAPPCMAATLRRRAGATTAAPLRRLLRYAHYRQKPRAVL